MNGRAGGLQAARTPGVEPLHEIRLPLLTTASMGLIIAGVLVINLFSRSVAQ
ncbi:hypothetical protein [Hydrogenophaga sp. RWCD_12]|uniref:hypothetical protein n=1 Tax=Hydrogenophaga sp. RWCD_12 TaxID=3391190 RepID=UPI003984EFCF